MSDKKPVRDDVSQKIFFKNPERFADFCNAVLYDGEQQIRETDVQELDSEVSGIIRGRDGKVSLERRRDILRQVRSGEIVSIIGIENQTHIHYAMPLRNMTYDVLGYISEAKEIASQRKKQRNEKDIKESANEFLSGFGKEDRLTPIMTIILYYGEEPWEGPRSFHEMLRDMPEKFKEYIPNCRLNIVELNSDKRYDFHNEELKLLFDIARVFLQGDKEALEQYEEIAIDTELADILGTIIKSKFIIQQSETKGEVKMCTMLDEMEREAEERGEKRGEKRGREEGVLGIINILNAFGQSDDVIIQHLVAQMDLTEKAAKSYLVLSKKK